MLKIQVCLANFVLVFFKLWGNLSPFLVQLDAHLYNCCFCNVICHMSLEVKLSLFFFLIPSFSNFNIRSVYKDHLVGLLNTDLVSGTVFPFTYFCLFIFRNDESCLVGWF
jgi:hypothetical protein